MLEAGAQRFGSRRDAYFDSAEPPLIGWHKIALHDPGIYHVIHNNSCRIVASSCPIVEDEDSYRR